MNFLEQLVAEWYEYKGFFVRTNIKFGKRAAGGWEGEIDVVAFDPKKKHLIHVEASMDSYSWSERKNRFVKKFSDAKKHYKEVFDFDFNSVQNRVIVGFIKTKPKVNFSGIEVTLVPDFVQEVTEYLSEQDPMKAAVPESYPLLRAIQFATAYGHSTDKMILDRIQG